MDIIDTPGRRSSRTTAVAAVALACALTLAGCAREAKRLEQDDLARKVSLPAKVTRVVSLAPNITEILFAIGAGDRLVATDSYSDTPPAAAKLPKVGGLQPNVEQIASFAPDLVIATTNGNRPALEPALASVHVPLFVVRTDRISEIAPAMRRLGSLLGAGGADAAAAKLESAVAAQRRSRARAPRVLFVVWTDPLYVAGTGTFADDLLQLAGARNAVEVSGWPQYSLERLVADPPDLLLYPDHSVTPEQVRQLVSRVPSLATRTQLVAVDENRFTRPGPRVAEAAAMLNEIVDRWETSR